MILEKNNEKYNEYLEKFEKSQNKGAGGTRDSERKKLYRSERMFIKVMDMMGKPIPKFADIEEARRFSYKVYDSELWRRLFEESSSKDIGSAFRKYEPVLRENSRKGTRGFSGRTNGHVITLNREIGMDAYTLLHELAHCLGHMHHGRSFRKVLVELVEEFLGYDYRTELEEQFKRLKLAFGEAKKPLSLKEWMEKQRALRKSRRKRIEKEIMEQGAMSAVRKISRSHRPHHPNRTYEFKGLEFDDVDVHHLMMMDNMEMPDLLYVLGNFRRRIGESN